MRFFTGNPIDINKTSIWVASVVFVFAKRKISFFIILFIFSNQCISGQCPAQDYFKQKIISIYKPDATNITSRLQKLLQLQQQMKICNYQSDSVFMYLQRAISFFYYKRGNYDSAIYFTNQSIIVGKELLRNNKCQPLALIHNYYNLYFFYSVLQQEQNEFNAIDSCIAYYLQDTTRFKQIVLPILAKVKYLFNKGDYSQCIKDVTMGEEILQKKGYIEDSAALAADFVVQRASALYFADEQDSAKKNLERKISEFGKAGQGNQLGNIFSLLGLINKDEGKYAEAVYFLRKGIEKFAINKCYKGLAQNLAFIGAITGVKQRHYNEGLKHLAASLIYSDASDSSYVYRQKGNIYSFKNKYDSAQYFFQEAFNLVHPGMNENSLLQKSFQFPGFNELQNLSDLTIDKGDAFLRQYYFTNDDRFLAEAIRVYKANDLFLTKIKAEQNLQIASNLAWRNMTRSLYEHAIEACYANSNNQDAFYFFEKSRAVLLNDQINEQRWMADTDISKQAELKRTIADLDNTLNTASRDSDEYLKIQKELYLKNQQLDALTGQIKNKNPLYFKNYLDTSSITIAQLKKNILGDSKTLVEIFSGDSAVYVLSIAANGESLSKIDKHFYDSLTNSYMSFMANPHLLNQNFSGFLRVSHQLYTLLFSKTKPAYGQIIISPDGVNFPFEALTLNEDVHSPDYFLNHYAVSYAYSAQYLTNPFTDAGAKNNIMGIAPVNYHNYPNLSSLSGSSESLQTINSYFGDATNFILDKATKNNFLQNFADYKIVQLYAHASSGDNNQDPVIYFSDSALFLSNLIPDRKPVTQLIILSACETAEGKFYQGEGIFSFNRGFAALGIPAAVSNLWSVDNESTYRITELFYKYLSKGLPSDIALQKAKLEFINKASSLEDKLPYFWAGPVLTGKAAVLGSVHRVPWLKIGVAIIILLLTVYFFRKLVLKNQQTNK